MAFKLSKADINKRDELADQLATLADTVSDAVTAANLKISAEVDAVNGHIAEYNAACRRALEFCENLAEDWQSQYEERSQRWQEGDAGQAAESFAQEWSEIEINEMGEARLPALDEPDTDAAELLRALPESAGA